ncbi:putative white-brown complex homolog protein 30 [Rosa chinensis]|uniref:putative white-brown complex homolog protein 30 n=1 Tax=Rosa chinensis TaxID=74649 RepID=UPI000D092FAC|nr:putative white-brown complex homolog protein 30 [Rosa chinensis]
MGSSRVRIRARWFPHVVFIVVLRLLPCFLCQDEDDFSKNKNPATLPLVTQLLESKLSNLTKYLSKDLRGHMEYCIKNVEDDWNGAFNYTGRLEFLSNCIKNSKGEVSSRICTAAEMRYYFSSFTNIGITDDGVPHQLTYLKPNLNCNLTNWEAGCEPGWGCSLDGEDKVDLKVSHIPARTTDCQPCCEGFFCPEGITCMIPCPLGAYCPRAKLNQTSGLCDPYTYQVPAGEPNHTCGGADVWTDASKTDVFCSSGSYCPTTIKKYTCSSGFYCRMGSTYQKPCLKLTDCGRGTANQKIHAYGIFLVVALSFILIIIYNCSDQVLLIRERKAAKSREAAARHARETAQARERWKAAKEGLKKRKVGLQEQMSRTFSRKKSTRNSEPLKISGHLKPGTDHTSTAPKIPGTLSSSEQLSPASKSKNKEPSNLTQMLQSLDDDPHSTEGFNLQIGDKNIKRQAPKVKNLHTHSQIFKYAYGQLEKEKAMQQESKNLTFTGIIQMAKDTEVKTRPAIEVDFKDLTLTLKGKDKNLLRSVTGKLFPGRVSAVMGPSGAGKTTFLSALSGKVTGCTVTGSILINGKAEPMTAYKRIIGFVPQDDVVHGNLTVEENLRFSARCRLSANMPKPDKVLVVERVIEALGLGAVRDSVVGTVEKRGISGGQRKRVNVGLEMVMEPSLLILDEPTTGLDSASSQLLLKALRREAREGVNICMVLHQPSYSLFRMFDDFILLAKGGLTVYHGSVKKVEEYFAGIGIVVPERVNPPDYFIDILEGIVKPSSGVNHEELPVRWMLHNGYPVPQDMMHYLDGIAASSAGPKPVMRRDQSFAGDLWRDVKTNVEVKKDHLRHNFLVSQDLSDRITPGIFRQYRYYLGRVGKQRLRDAQMLAADYLIMLLAGAILGIFSKMNDETFGFNGYTYTVIAVSLLCKISALRTFSLDKLHYWRESASGISSLAHFLSKDTMDHFNTVIKPLVYLSTFYFFSNPRSSFQDNYIVLLCLVYCTTGIGYALAIYLDPSPAQLSSVLLPVVLTLIATQAKDSKIAGHVAKFCYTKWALEAFVIANAERYSGVWLISRCTALYRRGYDLNDWTLCLVTLVVIGLLTRILAFILLLITQKR